MRFNTGTLAGSVVSAKLRLYVTNGAASAGGTIRGMTDTTWSETDVTYKRRPAIDGPQVGTFGNLAANTWLEVDVTAVVTGPGLLSFGLRQTGSDDVDFASRENATALQRPQLVITTRAP